MYVHTLLLKMRRLPRVAMAALFGATAIWMAAGTASAESFSVRPGQGLASQISRLSPGDTLFFEAGTYNESISLHRSGSSGRLITLKAQPGAEVIIASSQRLMEVDKSFWLFENLIFDQRNASTDAIKIGSVESITFRGCTIRNGSRDGIDIRSSASDITIDNCTIHDFQWSGGDAHGIVANPGVRRLTIINSRIYNCSGDCIQLYASGSDPVSSYSREVVIRNNKLYTTNGANSENALDFKGVDGCLVEGNEMYGFSSNKAFVIQKGCRNITIERNIIRDSDRGLECRGENGLSQENIIIRKNLFYNIANYYAVKFDWVSNVQFVNNTVAFSSPTVLLVEEQGLTNGVFRNNIFYRGGAPKIKATFQATASHNGWYQTDASDVAGASDKSGSDPGFVNANGFDFRLRSGSPAIDAGTDVGLPFTGSAPDLGAFEFGEPTTPVRFYGFSGAVENGSVVLSWNVAGSSDNQGFTVERAAPGNEFIDLGFVAAQAAEVPWQPYSFIDRNPETGENLYRLRQRDLDGQETLTEPVRIFVGLPDGYQLESSWPNPFSLSTHQNVNVTFFLPKNEQVAVKIYNLLGQVVQVLQDGQLQSGRHTLRWNGMTAGGVKAAPGLYFYELRAGSVRLMRSFVTLR